MNARTGLTIASFAVAGFLTAATAAAGDKAPEKKKDDTVKCAGVNECKGKGACGGDGHDCAGKNGCKGKGWVKLTEKECKDKGGKVVP